MSNYNFFSGMLGVGSSNSGTGLWSMYSSIGDYNSIRSGSYRKLLNAYYKETQGEDTTKKNKVTSTLNKNKVDSVTKQEMNDVKKTTDTLQKSAAVLMEKKSGKSVYGEEDKEKLASAVKDFVTDYNKVIDKAGASSNDRVSAKVTSMVNNTNAYAKSLSEIGITVGKDNKLSVDTDKLKNADTNTVKGMLQAGNSFVGQTLQKASQIGAAAENASVGANLYSNSGNYMYQNVNSLFDSYL